jgi:hypothetical protein
MKERKDADAHSIHHQTNRSLDIMSVVLEGGCLCGKVRFSADQPPLRTFACHCKFCQRVTGTSFYAESIFPLDAVQFNDGELRQYEHLSEGSKKKVFVHFCPSCGTTVGLTFERWSEVRAISRGCYDDPNAVEITSHIWTESAQTGVVLPAGVECFVSARAQLDGQPEQPTKHGMPVMARQKG